MEAFIRSVGRVLRRERERNRLTLRDVQRRSGGRFTASGVGGYERGERMISLDRFCRLAELYGSRPDLLLAEVLGLDEPTVMGGSQVIEWRSGRGPGG